ncbi:hypothetical protein [Albibacterium indicum]|uniref:hypothetical protein n=1 Tax=Albibacterium indicum TaxID=2292082 RepID=UPI001300B8E1|nr:hypothetical protein [Pedobacter indicus]
MAAHKELKEWIPLYIGKSRNIASRIHGHIFRELDKTTFAMKLKSRENLYGQRFRISYIKLDVNNYDMLVPYVERRLRNKINPIVGKQ